MARTSVNRWVSTPDTDASLGEAEGVDDFVMPSPIVRIPGVSVDGVRLEQQFTDPVQGICLVGAHGGAGVSTLAGLCDVKDAGRQWPVTFPNMPNGVLVVARCNVPGIRAAIGCARQIAGGGVAGVDVLGVVTVADMPGKRLPKPVREEIKRLESVYPLHIKVGWISGLREGSEPEAGFMVRRALKTIQRIDTERME